MARVKNKRNAGLADKVHKKKKNEVFKKKINPFEVHVNKEKIKVLGQKSKHDRGLPGVSRAKAIKKRKETLGTELKLMNKSNTFIDKRIGEKDTALSHEERVVARFAAERAKLHSRKNIYNLADDEVLTHRGQTLEQIEKFDDPRSSDEEDEDGRRLPGGLDDEMVSSHFGGGALSHGAADGARAHRDLIERLVAESKKRKHEKQKEKENTLDLTEKLDSEWKDLQPMVAKRARAASPAAPEPPRTPAEARARDYDKAMRELRFEKRGTPSDGLKSEEQQLKEERQRYEQLQRERERRMLGEDDDDAPTPQTGGKHRSADDLDDNFALEDDGPDYMLSYDAQGNPLVPEHIFKANHVPKAQNTFEDGISDTSSEEGDDENDGNDKEDDDDDDEENSEEEDADGSESDETADDEPPMKHDNKSAAKTKGKTESTNNDESEKSESNKTKNEHIQVKSNSPDVTSKVKPDDSNAKESNIAVVKKNIKDAAETPKDSIEPEDSDESEEEEEEGDDDEENDPEIDNHVDLQDLNDLRESDADSEGGSEAESEGGSEADEQITNFFEAVGDDNLKELLSDKTPAQQASAVQKLIKQYDPSTSSSHKDLLSKLYAQLLQYIHDLFSNLTQEGEVIRAFLVFEKLAPFCYDLAHTNKVSSKQYLADALKKKHDEFLKNRRTVPDLSTLIFFKLASLVYPTSDFRHPITTPSMVFMAEILTHCRFRDATPISRGLFVTALLLEYTVLSKRYVPAAINFLRGVLYLTANTSVLNPVQVVPPFKLHRDAKLLSLDDDSSHLTVDSVKMAAKDLVARVTDSDFKIRCLSVGVAMLKEFFDNTSDIEAQECIFAPHLQLLSRIDLEWYPKSVAGGVQEVMDHMKQSLEVKTYVPLHRERKKPKALRLYEPEFQEVFTGSKSSNLSREQAERAKLQHKLRRETRGAVREVRRDRAYLAAVAIRQRIQSDNVRKEKVKQIYKDASIQQGELNKLKRTK